MKFKKIIASVLSVAMLLSMVSISVFAANVELSLTASKDIVAAGDQFTVTLPMDSTNTIPVGSATFEVRYDQAAFEYVSITSEFDNGILGNNYAENKIKCVADDYTTGKATGDLAVLTFRVKNGALGGDKIFSASIEEIVDVDGNAIGGNTYIAADATVKVQAPEKLAAPSVTIADKTASWEAVTGAKEYNVVLKKGETEIYNKDQTATEFDFSKFVTETARYTVIVTCKQNGALHTASDAGEVFADLVVNSAITPTTKDYVKGSGGFDVAMTLNGNTLVKITNGTTDLIEDTDYTIGTNSVRILEAAITDDAVQTFTFNFSAGDAAMLTVNVKNAAEAVTFILAEREKSDNYNDDDETANDGTNDGLIVVTNSAAPVTNFIAAQFSINNVAELNYDKVEYEIVPADGFAILYDESTGLYEINVKPADGVTPEISETEAGKGIVIGKLVRKGTGYGKGTIKAGNIRVTVEKSDNTYDELTASDYSFQYDIPEPVETLIANVDLSKLPTEADNIADYQKMALKLYSSRLGYIDIKLGKDVADTDGVVYKSDDEKIKATLTQEANKYQVIITGLPKFDGYTLAISGDGYRDAKAQFVLNEETTVNFWNNANDADSIYISKKDSGTEKMVRKNFLAGDIIMNNVIDLYDLSAVSSYYGKKELKEDADLNADYIQYDLNRDGQVDIIDITMLLAGWAE